MKLISLNLETDKHYKTALPFLEKEAADVVCLQEIPESFIKDLEQLGYFVTYSPMTKKELANGLESTGLATASRQKPEEVLVEHYHIANPDVPVFDNDHKHDTENMMFISSIIDGYHVVTTHFTWTPDGSVPNDHQKEDLPKLLNLLNKLEPHVLCGDMNIPRCCNFLYQEFIKQYQDEVPEHYLSSLDKDLHRCGSSEDHQHLFNDYVVDYIFSQPPYRADDVRLEFGVSDHAAVVGNIFKDN